MNETMPYADIVLLALIAGFVLLRLRSILGQKGEEEEDFFKRMKPLEDAREKVVQRVDKTLKIKIKDEPDNALTLITDTAVVSGIEAIKAKDAHFTVTRFLDGAKMAFEMVHEAFTKGDKQTLSMLLSDTLQKEFVAEIDARATKDLRPETTLVSVLSKEIKKASLDNHTAQIVVAFTSEQISVIRNAEGKIIEGDPSQTQRVEDEWVFERDVTAKNPNWKIIET